MIVFCGYANSDITVAVPVLPRPGDRVQATGVRRGEGGMGANAAVAAARAGADVRFAGVVGADPLSDAFLRTLGREGVDVAWTARTGELTTAVVLLTPDGERAIISQDDAVLTGHIESVLHKARDARAGWFYLDGYRFPAAADVIAAARAHGETSPRLVVDLDGGDSRAAVLSACAVAGHAIVGRAQARALLGGDPELATTAATHRVHLVVTDGARGWTMFTPYGDRYDGPAISVDAADATGAGDCFAGTYCAELDRGATPLDAARFAAVAAGLSCTRPGAREGLPYRDEVLAHPAFRTPADTRPQGEETPCEAP